MENPWELYSTHPQFAAANTAINKAWDEAKSLLPDRPSAERAKAAEQHVYAELKKWSEVGAMDTEPVNHLAWNVYHHFGVSGGYV